LLSKKFCDTLYLTLATSYVGVFGE
jgi:hypothetical protein